ncbi:hypothetical protein IEZ26_11540 [Nocardioides cavernae]|uniref:Uncharacterized protein n=1 Tax=Nocardioides cavernae TaxID=1921566 RepID=A0ABR8NEF9_9ACTN|nr:hypothetical protein [Nocardioides cavernae]MBD3925259.1 hypothetical protein [Nocardioides cavernae]MBM7514362.1 hypothetical protein [Nocardioides cavernae]
MTTRARIRATAAAALLTLTAGCGAQQSGDAPAGAEPADRQTEGPAEQDTGHDGGGLPRLDVPVTVGTDLLVGGEQVPGRWYAADGRGTHWIALRDDRTWWWGYDDEPQRIEGQVDQSVVISPGGGYSAQVLTESGNRWRLVGADTEEGGEGLGAVDLPQGAISPPPRALAATDDGLVVAGGPDFQWLWRPLVDDTTVDLAETAPGQVVLGSTDAGLLVNEGRYDRTDGTQGTPYLARLAADGTLIRLDPVPTHDVLEAGEQWLAYVPPGSIGGEAWTTTELFVQRRDGSAAGALEAPAGWRFAVPGFRWESADDLLALLVSPDERTQSLARCRPDAETCEVIHPAG